MSDCQVIIIGAGISGSLTAIALSDAGIDVILVDRHASPMEGASRWNEGKIHLGYCYLGDPSFDSVNLMLDGAACFIGHIERLTESRLQESWFSEPFIYLLDTKTQFPPDYLWQRSLQLSSLLKHRALEERGLRRFTSNNFTLERLDTEVAAALTGTQRISAAWQTNEIAISPGPVASMIRGALDERQIPFIRADVRTVNSIDECWNTITNSDSITSDAIINASWESRTLLDRQVLDTGLPCSIRYKYAIFGHNLDSITALTPSTRVVGQFGDITPYGNDDAYLSWYPVALAGLSDDGTPPSCPHVDAQRLATDMLAGLGFKPSVLTGERASWELRGGYVVARGHGDIDHANSPLHARSHPGVFELSPGYISIDTGKYSLGPLMARKAANMIKNYLARR